MSETETNKDQGYTLEVTLLDNAKEEDEQILNEIWNELDLQKFIKENMSVAIRFDYEYEGWSNPYLGSAWASHYSDTFSCSLEMNKTVLKLPKEIKKKLICYLWIEKLNQYLERTNQKVIDHNTAQDILDAEEYVGSKEFSEAHQKEFLKNHRNLKKAVKGCADLNEVVQSLVSKNILTEEEIQGIEYRWYTGSRDRYDPIALSSRSMRVAALSEELGHNDWLQRPLLEYMVWYVTKLLNMDMIIDSSTIDNTAIKTRLIQEHPMGDVLSKELHHQTSLYMPSSYILAR